MDAGAGSKAGHLESGEQQNPDDKNERGGRNDPQRPAYMRTRR
jgi:hypothetical protein